MSRISKVSLYISCNRIGISCFSKKPCFVFFLLCLCFVLFLRMAFQGHSVGSWVSGDQLLGCSWPSTGKNPDWESRSKHARQIWWKEAMKGVHLKHQMVMLIKCWKPIRVHGDRCGPFLSSFYILFSFFKKRLFFKKKLFFMIQLASKACFFKKKKERQKVLPQQE